MQKSFRHIIKVIPAAILALTLAACHPIEEQENDMSGNFEALWQIVDQRYCFFALKDIDWDEAHARYAPKAAACATPRQLFAVCSEMLDELRDGHTNLSTGFGTSYYRNWWSDYPENFSSRLIEQYYFGFDYRQVGNTIYGVLPQNVGYIRIPSFDSGLSSGNISMILADLMACEGLILDIRNNGGGNLTNAETWARHFLTADTRVGYIVHKSGPGHDDFAEPYPLEYSPAEAGNIIWGKPAVLLTNRSTFSAANHFTLVLASLPQVVHCGATTGGGSGMPMSQELPNGWSVRLSAVRVLDARGRDTEQGISPDAACQVDLDPLQALQGRDSMLDFAVGLLTQGRPAPRE